MAVSAAICVKSVNETARLVSALWTQVGLLEHQPSMQALNYPPHFTFAIYDAIDANVLRSAASEVFSDCRKFNVRFEAIRYFDAQPLTLWLEPADPQVLQALHEAVHRSIDPALCKPHYRPDAWISHCTLGTDIRSENREAALEMTGSMSEPIDVVFDVGDCVLFPPVEVLEEYELLQD